MHMYTHMSSDLLAEEKYSYDHMCIVLCPDGGLHSPQPSHIIARLEM